MPTVEIVVKGAKHYGAVSAIASGVLRAGATVELVPEANNPHDSNAVAVVLAQNRTKLGHVSRELAARYREIIASARLENSTVSSVKEKSWADGSPRLRIALSIRYRDADASLATSDTTLQGQSNLPDKPGVYQITNKRRKRFYIGSTTNVRSRIRSHVHDLKAGSHDNKILQGDYSDQRGAQFYVSLLQSFESTEGLAAEEALAIREALRARKDLYNLTIDGQGRFERRLVERHSSVDPIPVSDRVKLRGDRHVGALARQKTDTAATPIAHLNTATKNGIKAKEPLNIRLLFYLAFVATVLWLIFHK